MTPDITDDTGIEVLTLVTVVEDSEDAPIADITLDILDGVVGLTASDSGALERSTVERLSEATAVLPMVAITVVELLVDNSATSLKDKVELSIVKAELCWGTTVELRLELVIFMTSSCELGVAVASFGTLEPDIISSGGLEVAMIPKVLEFGVVIAEWPGKITGAVDSAIHTNRTCVHVG